MTLRKSLSLLPRLLAGSSGNQAAFLPVCARAWTGRSNETSSTSAPAKVAPWRAYSTIVDKAYPADVQISDRYNPAVGMTAPTETGLSPVAHVRANPSHLVKYDESNHERLPVGDVNKRAFTYFVLTGARFAYASAIRLVVLKFILSMSASADVLAQASVEVGLPAIKEGATVTIKWRGKPVFVKHRTDEEIARERAVALSDLRDPQTDDERAPNPKWLVCLGVCTHLGCVPVANAGDYQGWFCPCHGSHYDASGRIRRGPAPYNLEIPEYKFLDDETMLIG